ncbi:hypothetical protein Taro_001053 [Colocasia esculenta]|uniref:Putative plant transposon protein domain-containing protein n=1 Tax=Colocasia esculenta TaxID=4460 RepID=A0A843T8V2_COLES|nr:hypothetical protein [Colocasia esculenta]
MAAPIIAGCLGGYSAEFLTPEEQERFTFVKTKLCGNKEVDVANLRKSGMSSLVELINQMQWTEISTFLEVSYPDLVKAFFVCMRTEEDGSLVSSVKGTLIRIDPELLKVLFNVKTSGFSGIHSEDAQVKGLGIIGPGFKLRDGKIDINQLSAFNRLLHFIVCQILVPRSATFSSCTKADSDMMYWAIQNKEINMAAVIMERMKFARDQIWDTKSKLNVSLPYAHLLIKIFKHFGVDFSGAVVEKMGQAIRSRNLKKSGFSVENGIWFKASVADGEAIIIDTAVVHPEMGSANMDPELPVESILAPAVEAAESSGPSIAEVQYESAVEEERASVEASGFPEEPVQTFAERRIEDLLPEDIIPVEDPHPSIVVASILADIIDSIPFISSAPEASSSVAKETVAPGHIDEQMEDVPVEVEHQAAQGDLQVEPAPSQGEQVSDEENAPIEGELSKEGHEGASPDVDKVEEQRDFSNLDDREGVTASSSSSDDDVPPAENKSKKKGKEAVSGLLADSPFQRKAKKKIVIQLKPVIDRLNVQGPTGPDVQDAGPSGPSVQESRPLESESVQSEAEEILAPKPPAPSSPSHTPIPPTPPSDPTAPPAPQTFNKPQSRPISSPTPFQSTIPSPSPSFEAPPVSSAGASSSSSGPSLGPTDAPHTTSHSFLHPTPPPSFITIIPVHAQLSSPFIEKIKDEFEEGILRSVLKVGDHIHRADPSVPASKKRKLTSTSSSSSEPKYSPLWFSLTVANHHNPLYREYLSKVAYATIINLPFQNLTDYLHTIFPYTSLSKTEKSKMFSLAHSKSEEQWGKGHKDLLKKFTLARSARFPPRDHFLTLSEWFRMYHKELWAPFIQSEIKMIRHFMLFNNYRYINKLPEVQLCQFKKAISALSPVPAHSSDIKVDFATLQIPEEIALPQIHFLVMESSVGSIIFERYAREKLPKSNKPIKVCITALKL